MGYVPEQWGMFQSSGVCSRAVGYVLEPYGMFLSSLLRSTLVRYTVGYTLEVWVIIVKHWGIFEKSGT